MDIVKCKIYNPKDENRNFIFPEQKYYNVDNDKVALALSGGGSRAFTMSMAAVRFLENMELMGELSYISTVSGSSWFIGPYMFRDLNLGHYRNPENITMTRLQKDNIGYAADVCINTEIMKKLREARHIHIEPNKIWSYIIGQCFLDKYDLNGKPIVMDRKRANYFMENNGIECEVPIEGRPFWLCNSSVLCDKSPLYLTSTPLYSGIPSRVLAKGKVIGGLLVETPMLDSLNPCIKLRKKKGLVNFIPNKLFTINDMVGTSSAAFTYPLEEAESKIKNFIGKRAKILESLNPSINFYDVNSKNNVDVVTTDGYRTDNLGIISLVARKCKKILCMSANLEIMDDFTGSNLLPLFGMWSKRSDDEFTDDSQIFSKKDWISIENDIRQKMNDGGPVYIHRKLKVLKNKRLSVDGGYKVELLIYFLHPSVEYISQLPLEVQEEIFKSNGKLNNFPHYKTTFQNFGSLCSYTREQINLLSYYTQWCLNKTKHVLLNFFSHSDENDEGNENDESNENDENDESDEENSVNSTETMNKTNTKN